jgi:hypothetical protein
MVWRSGLLSPGWQHALGASHMTQTACLCVAFAMAIFVIAMLAAEADARGRTRSHRGARSVGSWRAPYRNFLRPAGRNAPRVVGAELVGRRLRSPISPQSRQRLRLVPLDLLTSSAALSQNGDRLCSTGHGGSFLRLLLGGFCGDAPGSSCRIK